MEHKVELSKLKGVLMHPNLSLQLPTKKRSSLFSVFFFVQLSPFKADLGSAFTCTKAEELLDAFPVLFFFLMSRPCRIQCLRNRIHVTNQRFLSMLKQFLDAFWVYEELETRLLV